jgi:hypothetical protein
VTALKTEEVVPNRCDGSGLPLEIQRFGATQFEAVPMEAEAAGEREVVRDKARFAAELVGLRVADHEVVGNGVSAVSHRFAAHLAVGDLAVKMEALAAAFADEVVGENLSARIVLVDAVTGGIPNDFASGSFARVGCTTRSGCWCDSLLLRNKGQSTKPLTTTCSTVSCMELFENVAGADEIEVHLPGLNT